MAPHNLTFNKNAVKAHTSNRASVIESFSKILARNAVEEANQLKKMQSEADSASKEPLRKSQNVKNTEAILSIVNRNIPGKSVNGRVLVQPDKSLYQKLKDKELKSECIKKGIDLIKIMSKDAKDDLVRDFTDRQLLGNH